MDSRFPNVIEEDIPDVQSQIVALTLRGYVPSRRVSLFSENSVCTVEFCCPHCPKLYRDSVYVIKAGVYTSHYICTECGHRISMYYEAKEKDVNEIKLTWE